MLVLTRKPQQTIVVGDTTIVVVSIRGGSVRIGIDAPKNVPVWRGEIAPIQGPEPNSLAASNARGDDAPWARSGGQLSCK